MFLGVDGIVVSKKNSAPLTPTVSKVSSGAMELFPIHGCERTAKLLRNARLQGWTVLGAHVAGDAVSYDQYKVNGATLLVMGIHS